MTASKDTTKLEKLPSSLAQRPWEKGGPCSLLKENPSNTSTRKYKVQEGGWGSREGEGLPSPQKNCWAERSNQPDRLSDDSRPAYGPSAGQSRPLGCTCPQRTWLRRTGRRVELEFLYEPIVAKQIGVAGDRRLLGGWPPWLLPLGLAP